MAFEVRLEGTGTRLLKTESGRRAGKGFHRAAVENRARLSRESPSLVTPWLTILTEFIIFSRVPGLLYHHLQSALLRPGEGKCGARLSSWRHVG